jgi:uncharacterized protein
MDVSELVVDYERLAEVCQRFGVERLEVFGSLSRGEGSDESDVDLLYVLKPGRRLGWRIEELSEELSVVLGRPVDLVSRRAVHNRLREQVLAEATVLYAA